MGRHKDRDLIRVITCCLFFSFFLSGRLGVVSCIFVYMYKEVPSQPQQFDRMPMFQPGQLEDWESWGSTKKKIMRWG